MAMAEETFHDLAQLPAGQIAANDEIPVWDVSAGQAKIATRAELVGANITGGGTVATNGKNAVIANDGTIATLEAAQTFAAKQTFSAGVTSGTQGSVADDAAFSITAQSNVGILILMVANLTAGAGAVAFRCQSGFASQAAIIASAAGTLLATAVDTVLTGTTGADGKITISSNATDGKLYVENRSGGARVFSWFFITN